MSDPGIGHNEPPPDERLSADKLWEEIADAGTAGALDMDGAQRRIVWIKRARAIRDQAKQTRQRLTRPLDEEKKRLGAPFSKLETEMDVLIGDLSPALEVFVLGHGKTVRSEYGPAATLRSTTTVNIHDSAELPREYLKPNTDLIKAALKAGKVVPGANLKPSLKVLVK